MYFFILVYENESKTKRFLNQYLQYDNYSLVICNNQSFTIQNKLLNYTKSKEVTLARESTVIPGKFEELAILFNSKFLKLENQRKSKKVEDLRSLSNFIGLNEAAPNSSCYSKMIFSNKEHDINNKMIWNNYEDSGGESFNEVNIKSLDYENEHIMLNLREKEFFDHNLDFDFTKDEV